MAPPTDSEEFDTPARTLRGRAAAAVERVCVVVARWSVPLFLPIGCSFFVYLVGGYAADSLGVWSPQYEFLSLSEDVYFAWLGFLSGAVLCAGTGSLIGLAFLTEGEGRIHNDLSILSSFVGFGFGAGAVRLTYLTVLESLL